MKVIYIQDYGDMGGATKSLKELILKLHKEYGIEPIIITSDYNSVNDFAKANGFENYAVNHKAILISPGTTKLKKILKIILKPIIKLEHNFYNRKALKMLERKIDFNKIDLIHTNVNRSDFGAYLAQKHNIPHVWHIREYGDLDYGVVPLRKDYITYMNNSTTRFIAISKGVANHWINKGIDKSKVSVIYNGVDTSSIRELKEKEINDKVNIIFIGFLMENKGQIQAIEALNIMPNEYKQRIHIDFYGTGTNEYTEYLKKIVNKYNLDSNITFVGFDKEVTSKIKNYDIGLTCSKAEGFGRITVEYMLNGACVIASNTGANPEIIRDGLDGLLYEYDNIVDLKDKIIYLIDNKKIYSKLRINGYNTAINNFSSKTNSKNVYQLYKSLKK